MSDVKVWNVTKAGRYIQGYLVEEIDRQHMSDFLHMVAIEDYQALQSRLDHALKDVEAWRFAAGVNNTAREETDAENQQLRSRLDTARRAFDAWEASNERGESGPIDEELYVGLEALRVVERQKPGCDGKHGPPECSSPYCWRGPIMNA